ncbi:MAG: hypothetical protein JXJ17_12085 [Anaerolineae bacterium]|nr:hypothetical protein [Anaerolineae bacterium]
MMDYTITIFKKRGEPLYTLWIDTPDTEPQPGTVWEVVQVVEVTTEKPIPAALCGLLLMSESTSDKLFRQIADTWLGPTDNDPLDDYDRYASREESRRTVYQ